MFILIVVYLIKYSFKISHLSQQLTIEGTWSHNTHQLMFPVTQELARFSDIVGASHNKDFALYTYNSEASDGLKMLAEQGNTTKMELEILDMVSYFGNLAIGS